MTSTVTTRRFLHRLPRVPRFGGWRQYLIVRNGRVIRLRAAFRPYLLVDATLFPDIAAGLLRACHSDTSLI